ncbi:hypothetical protein OIU14_13370 [Thalassobacter stenotrophicus]|uniref:hypothetical protein n=1 Tax=Thalassobacter stenotrophicus TaxID=266809 RepID=UPI0022A9EDD3|nr:hypothetical protein [Thalassobacter stenotrophicus]UYP67457.1 hypothetical protein OIU14_13370 [Thalassobacter stenotrophicus]
MTELVLPSQNEAYGFYGQMTACALRDRPTDRIWTVACAFIGLATGAGTEDEMRGIRDFLDSSMGRHFADDVIDALQGRATNNETAIIKAIEKWQAWAIRDETQRKEGIPAGLPYLTGWVQHFAVIAAMDDAD